MILQPWRCIERKKTPAPSAVCTQPTRRSTTTNSGHSLYTHQLTQAAENTALEETVHGAHFTCPVWGEMSSYKLSSKYKGNLSNFLRPGHATAGKCYLDHLWTRRNGKLWHEEASQQTASKDVLVDVWAACDQGRARKAGTTAWKKHLFVVKSGLRYFFLPPSSLPWQHK